LSIPRAVAQRNMNDTFPYCKASTWCASWRLCAGSAGTHANVPALTAIITGKVES